MRRKGLWATALPLVTTGLKHGCSTARASAVAWLTVRRGAVVVLWGCRAQVCAWLQEGKDVRLGDWTARDIEILNSMQLLTAKPVVYLVNMSAKVGGWLGGWVRKLQGACSQGRLRHNASMVLHCAWDPGASTGLAGVLLVGAAQPGP